MKLSNLLKTTLVAATLLQTNPLVAKSVKNVKSKIQYICDEDYYKLQEIKYEMQHYNKYSRYGVKTEPYKLKIELNTLTPYYGNGLSINECGTYINFDLVGAFPEYNPKGDIIIVKKFKTKEVLLAYVNGYLEIATYVTPGRYSKKTPQKFYNSIDGQIDKYHASSNSEYRGAVMPYAVHITGGIWFHGSDSKVDGYPHSHGCIRVPLFYEKRLYELVKNGYRPKVDLRYIYHYKNNHKHKTKKYIKKDLY